MSEHGPAPEAESIYDESDTSTGRSAVRIASVAALGGFLFGYDSAVINGAVSAIEQGFQKQEIERSAYEQQLKTDSGERIVVGLNKFQIDEEEPYEPLRVDPAIEAEQHARLERLRADRDNDAVNRALDGVRAAAQGSDNILYPMKEALAAHATGGEVSNALRDVWGMYSPPDAF